MSAGSFVLVEWQHGDCHVVCWGASKGESYWERQSYGRERQEDELEGQREEKREELTGGMERKNSI